MLVAVQSSFGFAGGSHLHLANNPEVAEGPNRNQKIATMRVRGAQHQSPIASSAILKQVAIHVFDSL